MNQIQEPIKEFLHGLASETRQQMLLQAFLDGQEHTVGQVAQQIGLGQSTTSEHLAILKRAGILTPRREGKEVYYRPNRAEILARLALLEQFLACCCSES